MNWDFVNYKKLYNIDLVFGLYVFRFVLSTKHHLVTGKESLQFASLLIFMYNTINSLTSSSFHYESYPCSISVVARIWVQQTDMIFMVTFSIVCQIDTAQKNDWGGDKGVNQSSNPNGIWVGMGDGFGTRDPSFFRRVVSTSSIILRSNNTIMTLLII